MQISEYRLKYSHLLCHCAEPPASLLISDQTEELLLSVRSAEWVADATLTVPREGSTLSSSD